MSAGQWPRDLAMGVRFAFTGGREGWVRAALTAVGVGLGVALLLLTSAIPNALAARDDRDDARDDIGLVLHEETVTAKPSDKSLVVANVDTDYRNQGVRGRLLEPEGQRAPLPPGVDEFPAPGEMVVSPALAELLKSDDGKLLKDRLPYRVVGTIGEPGLIGSRELAYFAGADGLAERIDGTSAGRIERFGAVTDQSGGEEMDPVLVLLTLVVLVVLLMPVAVFIATAVRFGGERRDRRLAALRLVGADGGMTRRVAAGEALAGAVLGLAFGFVFFLIGREIAGSVEVFRFSVFPSYLNPSPVLAALVAVAVPASAVLVTLFALRGVVIEPLGVVRTAKPPRRRLWWRLLLPLAGLALLYPMMGKGADNGNFNEYMVTGGVVLLLVGVTALLPWAVEAFVARMGSGSLSWQLAVRRLQLSSGTAARMVNGIAVAVAGAIALQMLFAGVEGAYTRPTGKDTGRANLEVEVAHGVPVAAIGEKLDRTEGVRDVVAVSRGWVGEKRYAPEMTADVTIGDCAALREMAKLPSCRDGDVFVLATPDDTDSAKLAEPGRTLYFDPSYDTSPGKEIAWTVRGEVKKAQTREDSLRGDTMWGLLITPSALSGEVAPALTSSAYVRLDPSVPDATERVWNTAAALDPLADVWTWTATEQSGEFTSIRTGLFIGATCVLFLIGASLLVAQLEQLRERKKLLSALVAFGTRRRTLSLSVLWQTAIPIALGLTLSGALGLLLGAVLLKMSGAPVTVAWTSVLSMAGVGAGVVLAVTLLSLPPLLRLMRPDGLRTE
ncbi:FtsX-like permease family protein [Streptomyces acidicola]|uniref:FtsX-like permease family protein n=1 Tax=Streptomyces acidicola TaxID=2596892 RepID=A0A5N8WR78_9ACTN|nr:FtsX-like permease family protein [Streptomyces acidicola]MPY49662.1 FtsX-like permease family protein [Streptomyces acidicola]